MIHVTARYAHLTHMLTTLLELQRLKQLDRTGWTLRGLRSGAESVAAHSYGVVTAAMLLADEVRARGASVDMERVLRLAVMHDWAEARTGDLPRAAIQYYGAAQRKVAEHRAFTDIVDALGVATSKHYGDLYRDYEQRASVEARLAKAADVVDLLVQALTFERAGVRGLDEFWDTATEHQEFGLEGVAGEVVGELLQQLRAARPQAQAQAQAQAEANQ